MNQPKKPQHSNFIDCTFGHMEHLYRLAYARMGNAQDAEDAIQDTYLKAFRGFEGVRSETGIKSWLTKILLNTINDAHRKNTRSVATIDIDFVHEDALPTPAQCSHEDEIAEGEVDPQLLAALAAIPEKFLTPLLLREVHDATYEEIAHDMDIPLGTVMSRLSRGRSLLRSALISSAAPGDGQRQKGRQKRGFSP